MAIVRREIQDCAPASGARIEEAPLSRRTESLSRRVRRNLALQVVEREPEARPFVNELLRRWMALEFEPRPCRDALEALFAEPRWGAGEALLRPGAVIDGGVVATDALLYPSAEWSLRITRLDERGKPSWRVMRPFDETSAPEIGEQLRLLTTGSPDELSAGASWLSERMLADLTGGPPRSERAFPRIEAPGIYRREHGSVVIRSRTTSIMLDPVSFWMPFAHIPAQVDGSIDAIFVTHGHADHFNVASILAHAHQETLVVVPPVPRTSILAPNDMLRTLQLFGQRVAAPAWGTSLVVGDISVDVLPFYGEQPVKEGEGPRAELRNWGSCYRFTTPEFSALALIDSGVDPSGDMADVAKESYERRGPVDFAMSSLPRFHCPFFFGLPHYYLTLPFDRLRELHHDFRCGVLPSVTPGPDGIIEVCNQARARFYLPYGNGYEGLGVPIGDVGIGIGEPAEIEIIRYLRDRFASESKGTTALEWSPGDRVYLRGGSVVRDAFKSSSR